LDTIAQNENLEVLQTRLGVYRTLARFWANEIDEALWQGLSSASFSLTSDVSVLDDAYQKLEAYIRDAHQNNPNVLKDLSADYAVLCRGVNPSKGADPYESVHRNPHRLMMQDEWEDVLRLYREEGFKLSDSAIEPEDHLGIELECMALLCQRSYEALAQSDESAFDKAAQMQFKMLEEHLLLWVPSFTEAVLQHAQTGFYQAVAVITREYLQLDTELLRNIANEK
jgi:TorA maturation chaperone TorD